MSKWRPTEKNCIYVIGDVHGGYNLLKKICDRILPLRKSDGAFDRLILLGDYIDRSVDSHKVLDFCIELEKKYGIQVKCLMGNHELIFLQAFNLMPGKNMTLQGRKAMFDMWLMNGGFDTIQGYLDRAGIPSNALLYAREFPHRIIDLVPEEHIKFLQSLSKGFETDEFMFVHGGVNPLEPVSQQEMEVLAWDRKLVKYVLDAISKKAPLDWEKTIVCGHNVKSDKMPVVHDKYLMIDCGSPKQLLVVELRSREAFMAHPNYDRLVKFELKPTEVASPMFRRVT